MPALLLAAFIGVPILEIAVFIEVGGQIGLWPTLGLILLTAVIGSWQLRSQGLATLARGRAQLDAGNLPARELFDGLCLVLAGALLLTPGFVTDAFGLLLFVPPFRETLRRWLGSRMQARGQTRVWVDGQEINPQANNHGQARRRPVDDGVIEAEFEEVTPEGTAPGPEQTGRPADEPGNDKLEGPAR